MTGGLIPTEKEQFILDIQEHIRLTAEKNKVRAEEQTRMTAEKNKERAERMVVAPKPKAQSSYTFAPTTVAGRYESCESESCSSSESDDS